jgi:hypothetical protein
MQDRGLAAKQKRSESMVERWQDQEYRDLVTFTTSKPKRRTKPQVFSQEFLSHQGQLKHPKVQRTAREGQQRFLQNEQKYDQWIESLTIAQNKLDIKRRKSSAMKRRMAEKKDELAALRKAKPKGKQATKTHIWADAYDLKLPGISWPTLARKLTFKEWRNDPKKAGDSLRNGARDYAKANGLPWPITRSNNAQTQEKS